MRPVPTIVRVSNFILSSNSIEKTYGYTGRPVETGKLGGVLRTHQLFIHASPPKQGGLSTPHSFAPEVSINDSYLVNRKLNTRAKDNITNDVMIV